MGKLIKRRLKRFPATGGWKCQRIAFLERAWNMLQGVEQDRHAGRITQDGGNRRELVEGTAKCLSVLMLFPFSIVLPTLTEAASLHLSCNLQGAAALSFPYNFLSERIPASF